jgi:hypothetical protein
MKKVLIMTVGGRQLSNIQCVLAWKPNAVEFVASPDTPQNTEQVVSFVQRMPQVLVGQPVVLDDAMAWRNTYDAVVDIAQRHPGDELLINLTTGPTPMSIGAYEAAKTLQASAIYISTRSEVVTVHGAPVRMSLRISLDDYLRAHGATFNLVRSYRRGNKPADAAALEQQCFQAAKELLKQQVFDDVAGPGTRVNRGDLQKEVDVLCLRLGQPLIVECKAGANPWQHHDLRDLVAFADQIGAKNCTKVFVTSQHEPTNGRDNLDRYRKFQGVAKQQAIVLVTGDKLDDLAAVLRTEAVNPTYPRI